MGESKTSILLVEDEPIIALSESKMLTRNGYTVFSAHSGNDAIRITEGQDSIDLILMDIDLGSGLDGPETAEIILATKNLPVLFLSSHTEPEIVARTERITSLGYVAKNSGETVILASIRMALRLHEARNQLQAKARKLEEVNEELSAMIRQTSELNRKLEETLQEKELTEERLRITEAFLQKAQELGHMGSFILELSSENPDEQTWQSTATMDKILGIDVSYKKTGDSWLALIVQREEVQEYFARRTFQEGEPFEMEYQIVRPRDGQKRWIFSRGELEFGPSGNPVRMIGTVQDITDLRKMNEK